VATIERTLDDRRVVDDTLARSRALVTLARARPAFLADIARVDVNLPVDASALDVAVLSALARIVPVSVVLPVDEAPGRDIVVGVDAVFRRIEATGSDDVGTIEIVGHDVVGHGALAELRAALFTERTTSTDALSVVLPGDAEEEARLVVGAVAAWRAEHVDASVAVVARRSEQLTPTYEAMLRAGLPVRRRRRSLLESPAARLLLDLAALRLDDVPRDRLLAVLMNPARREALLPDVAARVLATLRRAAVRRDAEDHTRPSAAYRRRLEQLVRRVPEARGEVDFALQTIAPVMTAATTLPARATLGEHLQRLSALTRLVIDDARALGGSEVFEVVVRLAAAATRIGDRGTPIELYSLVRLVEHELARQPWLDDDTDVDDRAIELTTIPELAGRRFDMLVVVGAVEGELPQPGASQQSLVADVDRLHLNAALGRAALPIAVHDDAAAGAGVETVWWMLGLCAAQRRLLVTAPRRSDRGREQAPSAWLLELARAIGVGVDTLTTTGLAGRPVPLASDRRQQVAAQARAVVAGSLDDASNDAVNDAV
ncbi:MAG TPA: hypothetical protein VGF99_00045, partial [Myxococcota bacterium]